MDTTIPEVQQWLLRIIWGNPLDKGEMRRFRGRRRDMTVAELAAAACEAGRNFSLEEMEKMATEMSHTGLLLKLRDDGNGPRYERSGKGAETLGAVLMKFETAPVSDALDLGDPVN